MKLRTLLGMPDAFLPIAMSCIALALVIFHVLVYGVQHEVDEGTAAHVFQLLIAAQVPIVLFFAVRFMSKEPRKTAIVIALQIGAALMALAPVRMLSL